MVTQELTVQNKVGLHARPAAVFVQEAKKFSSVLVVNYNGRQANAKSLLGILGLGVKSGARIVVSAEGEDEQIAINELRQLVESNFGGT